MFLLSANVMPRHLAQQRMTFSDLRPKFYGDRCKGTPRRRERSTQEGQQNRAMVDLLKAISYKRYTSTSYVCCDTASGTIND